MKNLANIKNKGYTMDETLKFLIEKEIERAIELYGKFNSPHEAHSVLSEELEEINEEYQAIEEKMNALWRAIRNNYFDADDISEKLDAMETYSNRLINEAIQVSAMIKQLKIQQVENKWK